MTPNLFIAPIGFHPGDNTGNVIVAPGTLAGSASSLSTSGTTLTDLASSIVPAKAISQDGDWLFFRAFGTYRPSVWTAIKASLNGVDIVSLVGPGTLAITARWMIEGTVLRSGSSSAEVCYVAYLNDSATTVYAGGTAPGSLAWTSDQTLKVQAETSNATYPVTQKGWVVQIGNRL